MKFSKSFEVKGDIESVFDFTEKYVSGTDFEKSRSDKPNSLVLSRGNVFGSLISSSTGDFKQTLTISFSQEAENVVVSCNYDFKTFGVIMTHGDKVRLENEVDSLKNSIESSLQDVGNKKGENIIIPQEASVTKDSLKRPGILTGIAILWFIGGLINVYFGSQTLSSDLQALPYLSNPTIHEWFKFGVPAELALSVMTVCVGLLQFVIVFGFWKGKSFSYRIAFVIPVLLLAGTILGVGLYASAPAELGLNSNIASTSGFVMSVFWLFIIWNWLRKKEVKRFLGVTKDDAAIHNQSHAQ